MTIPTMAQIIGDLHTALRALQTLKQGYQTELRYAATFRWLDADMK